jgi:hypothetical protein
MNEVEELVESRLLADTDAVNGIVTLLGGAGHIVHAFQTEIPEVPYLTFQIFSAGKGLLTGNFARSLDLFFQFNIFAVNYPDIMKRLRQLFDGYRFDIPTNFTDVGQVRSVFEFEGPDGYDETLEVQSKQVRYRFFVTPKAWNPITA